jgi:hypothetical protein
VIKKFRKKSAFSQKESLLSIGNVQQFQWLNGIIKTVIVLNLIDALFTLFWVHAGLAKEANILLKDLINDNPVVFVIVKVALVSLGTFLLWRYRKRSLAVIGIFSIFLIYYFVLLYHLKYSSLLIRFLATM